MMEYLGGYRHDQQLSTAGSRKKHAFLTTSSMVLKPEENPTLLEPVISYGMHGMPYSARTTLWFAG
jgi:hypothetical protein